jgi:tRNA A-37 threonylcarbamoyl transferase component Bud32
MIEVVEELHSYGFIHQDIKLDHYRIMNNRVVLIDFGKATSYKE